MANAVFPIPFWERERMGKWKRSRPAALTSEAHLPLSPDCPTSPTVSRWGISLEGISAPAKTSPNFYNVYNVTSAQLAIAGMSRPG